MWCRVYFHERLKTTLLRLDDMAVLGNRIIALILEAIGDPRVSYRSKTTNAGTGG